MTERLRCEGVSAGYFGREVIRDVSLSIPAGLVVALLGANGAGKTTLLRVLCGQLGTLRGAVYLNGERTEQPLHRRVRAGLAYVGDDRSVFMDLTVGENLRIRRGVSEAAVELFPELMPLWKRKVGLLSGGEQQMVAIGRAIGSQPSVLLVDELSLGLAPLAVARLLRAIRGFADAGGAVLLVEQHVRKVLRIADFAYVLSRGTVVRSGTGEVMRRSISDIEIEYLRAAVAEDGLGP